MRADLAETNELVDLLLNYVAPAGAVALAEPDESDGPAPLVTNVTLGPARIGSILAAGYLVRWCPALWKRFRAPWRARREEDASADCLASAERAQRDAQSALYRLVLKGLDISRIEDAVNGTDRVRAG